MRSCPRRISLRDPADRPRPHRPQTLGRRLTTRNSLYSPSLTGLPTPTAAVSSSARTVISPWRSATKAAGATATSMAACFLLSPEHVHVRRQRAVVRWRDLLTSIFIGAWWGTPRQHDHLRGGVGRGGRHPSPRLSGCVPGTRPIYEARTPTRSCHENTRPYRQPPAGCPVDLCHRAGPPLRVQRRRG